MSYSSETEVSDEDLDLMKKEFNAGKIVHPEVKTEIKQEVKEKVKENVNEMVYEAVVLEDNDTSTLSDELYSPEQSPVYNNRRPYNTRSNKRFKKEEVCNYSEEEYDDRYDDNSFHDDEDYSDVDWPTNSVFTALHATKSRVKKEEKEKKPQQQFQPQQQPSQQLQISRRKPNLGDLKRTRKFALPWTAAESKTLAMLVNLYGAKEWQFVAKILQSKHNNNRTAAQCSQRWCRVINPAINKGPWDMREDQLLCEKFDDLQGSWCKIVKFFPDRTDTQCKRRYEKLVQLRARC